jgi:NodT family efflux transporter outer membrane factor (OMF) lipoprotein
MRTITALPLVLSLLAGCAVGPDFETPKAPDAAGYSSTPMPTQTASAPVRQGEAQTFKPGQDIAADWWHLFKSESLNLLVEQALANNPTLPAAQAALRVAHENTAAQRGLYLPQVSAQFSASRNLTPLAALSPASASGSPYYSLITPQLNVSFVPDVFGANSRAVEGLDAVENGQRFALEATWVTLTSNVVSGAIQEAALRGQIKATQDTIKAQTDLLRILHRQQELGQAAGSDVAAQETALAQSQLLLPPLEKQLAQQRDALTALAGRLPTQEIEETFSLENLVLPTEIPVSIPADMLRQRPDVRQAEENLHAASAGIGQAVAARLPQIGITGQLGNSSSSLDKLFTPGTNFWTITGGLTQPLFDGFSLLHKERAARAAFDQASEAYRGTVLTAFQNVADSLKALDADAKAVSAAAQAQTAASRSLSITRRQLELGQVAYLALLTAETAEAQSRIALVQVQATRLSDTAALFQSLGGGWWHRESPSIASR